jgi:hypothetical protein
MLSTEEKELLGKIPEKYREELLLFLLKGNEKYVEMFFILKLSEVDKQAAEVRSILNIPTLTTPSVQDQERKMLLESVNKGWAPDVAPTNTVEPPRITVKPEVLGARKEELKNREPVKRKPVDTGEEYDFLWGVTKKVKYLLACCENGLTTLEITSEICSRQKGLDRDVTRSNVSAICSQLHKTGFLKQIAKHGEPNVYYIEQ